MRLLFDQNLSRHLVHQLAVEYPDSRDVTELGLDAATDREIWDAAGRESFVIVSKDSDYRQFAFLLGPLPKAIWLRMGNASTLDIYNALVLYKDAITDFAASEDEALLVIPTLMSKQ
ncbi:MAG: DUF5615 family PIN-like protein [Acidimicrobiia bacterium]